VRLRHEPEDDGQGDGGGQHDRHAPSAGNRVQMNLPAPWGVYQSKPRRPPSNHGG
jgi:hypothetical protein